MTHLHKTTLQDLKDSLERLEPNRYLLDMEMAAKIKKELDDLEANITQNAN